MIWRNPAAWLGLATLLIPIAIHLLARQRAESRLFPSLRFIHVSRLAAVRRRAISDWPLLLIRLAILALVVAALADPLWLSAARRAEWSARVAKAIVVDTSASASTSVGAGGAVDRRGIVERETAGAFRSTTIETTDLADGIRRAADWLSAAPPARREIVLLSDFQLGALDPAPLRDAPAHIGLRFVRTGATVVTRDADGQPRTHRAAAADRFEAWTPHVTLNAHETAVAWRPGPTTSAPRAPVTLPTTTDAAAGARIAIETTPGGIDIQPFNVRVDATEADRALLVAAAEGVLAQGVRLPAAAVANAAAGSRVSSGGTAPATDRSATGPIEIVVARDRTALPRDVTRIGTPWMADALARIATDAQLARAVGRVSIATPVPDRSATASPRDSTRDSSRGASGDRESLAVDDAPSPWIVVSRDAHGRPAVAAASSTTDARLVIVSRIAPDDEATALLLRAALRAVAGPDPLTETEVLTVDAATLAQWQRPAADLPASDWQHVESHDRRWLWGAALLLLVVEQVIRRNRRAADGHQDQAYEHAA